MRTPTIHLGGTGSAELVRQVAEAHEAVVAARAALCAMWPNGRDYYPQGPQAIREAEDEHAARLRALDGVLSDLTELADVVMTEHLAREARRA